MNRSAFKFVFTVLASMFTVHASAQNNREGRLDTVPAPVASPEFPGGVVAFRNFIADNLVYPYSAADSIKGVQGKVMVQFRINQDGKVSDVKAAQGFDPRFDSAAMRVISMMPLWTVGNYSGRPFMLKFAMPFTFRLSPAGEDNSVHNFVEVQPQFDGGIDAMSSFIRRNLKYPDGARSRNIQGKVFVQFVVNKDGSISDAETIDGISPDCDLEAARVVSIMPHWIPGTQDKKRVRVKYVVPINFRLTR